MNSVCRTDCPSSRQKYLPPGEITVYAELLPPSRDSQLRADTPARLYPVEEGQSHLDVAGSRGEHRTNPLDRLQYVRIGPANARFGCRGGDCSFLERSSEQPTKIEGFWLGATEVTVGACRRFAEAAGQEMPPPRFFDRNWENSDLPIVNVTWDEARTYCEWIGGRLPSEDEWEYAAAGGNTDDSYPWGPELSHDDANYPYLSQKEGIDFYLRRVRDLWYSRSPGCAVPSEWLWSV